ncbi:MAG: ornithine carbamoyltransferase [Peptococcaceae bacterium]|jgi:ornithine carbamoyltransferase|nr:ornithine carbamoyltransferase [Peptococcaceae bacterium]
MKTLDQAKYQGRDFLTFQDYTQEELLYFIEVGRALKAEKKAGIPHPHLAGKTLGMIFTKSSTRTRVSFEVGMWQLGGHALFLSNRDIQLGRGETVGDTARTLSRMVDGVMIRTYSHDEVLELAEYCSVPVINGLTDLHHPCQVLGDLMTVQEYKGRIAGLKMTFIGDGGNNMAHSLLYATKLGMRVTIASPPGYQPLAEVVATAEAYAEENGGSVTIVDDPLEGAAGADVLYTDVWASMGMEEEAAKRQRDFAGYQINGETLKAAAPDSIVLHCLPAHRGEEITDEVLDGPHSVVFEEAENRLHIEKAIMALLM